ncbi:NAD kinase [Litoribacter ruber]|uniref:NAD kinase n=1 Tax=Litoribacter ruber TaxID=702568 RepID=A0AAP2G1K7_9BACT|nr:MULTISPECIES: NAD kinase [Litoribacter]MBS9524317.1 NAD kinase [Litoribacter alkaliphilus]MBT0809883.1 NAD kinase [Litoribacter ruber]
MNVTLHGLNFQKEFVPYIEQLLSVLHHHGAKIFFTEPFHKFFKKTGAKSPDFEVLSKGKHLQSMDFIISVGGDGTFLDTVSWVGAYQIPILGINTGRLGFLATIAKEEVEKAIQVLFEKHYTIEDRTLIGLETNKSLFNGITYGLNEFTIHKRDTSSMITVHTYIDGEYLNSYWADGLIVSTPTGSTGYSLSCGGPLITPRAKNFVLTPVSPHNLNVRPMIVPDDCKISFDIEGRSKKFLVSLDSRSTAVAAGIKLTIRKEDFVAKLVKFNDYNFFDTLRQKLNWGLDMRN